MSDSTPPLLKLWKKFNGSAPQRGLFSLGYALKAPYFRTVAPRVREVEPGRAVLRLGKWWGVQNHIGTFHVIAALNGASPSLVNSVGNGPFVDRSANNSAHHGVHSLSVTAGR